MVIVARTLMMIPRPGTATLAAAGIAAERKGWDPATDTGAVMFDALFTFFFTELLLGAILAYHAACRLHTKVCRLHILNQFHRSHQCTIKSRCTVRLHLCSNSL